MSLDDVSNGSGSPLPEECESNTLEIDELEAAELEAERRAEAKAESASQSQRDSVHEPVKNPNVHIHVHAHCHFKQVKVEDFGTHRTLSTKTSQHFKRDVSHENICATLHQHWSIEGRRAKRIKVDTLDGRAWHRVGAISRGPSGTSASSFSNPPSAPQLRRLRACEDFDSVTCTESG
eukprot:s486_g9.t1